ncbi:MAG TPA: glycosyltransferase [Gemmatimonadales bacterium]|nr:glycosyltransferase [Gemmatimonadales bacterium]
MTARPRLLFLCSTLPYPPDSGQAIRSFHVLRLLARAFDVTALCFYRRTPLSFGRPEGWTMEQEVAQRRTALEKHADVRVEAFPIPQEHSTWRLAWDHLRSIGLKRVYSAFTFDSSTARRRIVDLLDTHHFDVIHLDSIMLSGYLPLLGDLPVVCVHHNIESVLLRRRALAERSLWRRAYLLYQARLMEQEMRRACGRCQLNVVVSEAEQMELQRIVPEAKCTVVPNGVDIEAFQPGVGREEGLVFVGGMNWFPNRDALQYFCEAILPRVRGSGEVAPVRWLGGGATDEARRQYRDRYAVELTGYVPDVRPYVRDAACYVVPLRVGGGTRLKILDAWAMGKAVVSTSVGCEGLAAEDGRNILIRDDPDSFAQAVCAVLRDGGLRRRLGTEGRQTAERCYSWEGIGGPMLKLYHSVQASPTGPRGHTRATHNAINIA